MCEDRNLTANYSLVTDDVCGPSVAWMVSSIPLMTAGRLRLSLAADILLIRTDQINASKALRSNALGKVVVATGHRCDVQAIALVNI